MKKILLFSVFSVLTIFIHAQEIQNQVNGLQFRPYSKIFLESRSDVYCPATSSRSIVYRNVAYRIDKYNMLASAWEESDSGTITFNDDARRTSTHSLKAINGSWDNNLQFLVVYTGSGLLLTETSRIWVPHLNN